MFKRTLLILLMLALAGCQFGNLSVQPNGNGTATVTITLTEADVNGMVQAALTASANPLLRDPKVDLQPGQIVINGTHNRRDGNGTVSGSLTATVSVSGGKVQAQVTSANIEGVPLGDAAITELNQRLAERFGERINRENDRASVDSVTITDSNMQIVLTVSRR